MYSKELQHLGLSEKEAKVYLASLELGPDTAQNIAKKAAINRPTAYVQIESLKHRGLMSETQKGKKTLYSAESPRRLSSLLNSLEKELAYKKTEIDKVLPSLTQLFESAGERPKVRFYEGSEGIRAVEDDFLRVKNKFIQGIINMDKLRELFPNHTDYSKRRIAKKIKSQVIYTQKGGALPAMSDPAKLREGRYITPEKFPISSDISIYDNKVALVPYKPNPIVAIVENQEIADTMRALFFLIWNSLQDK